MTRNSLFLLLFTFLSSFTANAQEKRYPIVGQPIPYFKFNKVHYYSEDTISSASIKGKFIIIDLFARNCVGCFASFPMINRVQKDYKGKLQFFLLGNVTAQDIYEKFRKKYQLQLPVTYDDATLYQFNPSNGVPKDIWIDDKGIVKAITGPEMLTRQNIDEFIAGKNFTVLNIQDYSYENEVKENKISDSSKPIFINGNYGSDTGFLYRSILGPGTGIRGEDPPIGRAIKINLQGLHGRKGYQCTMRSLERLYKIAFSGKDEWSLLDGDTTYGNWAISIETKDSLKFKANSKSGEGYYNYSIIAPDAKMTARYVMVEMQRDLERYFGYDAKVIVRQSPYWAITITDYAKKKLKSKDSTTLFKEIRDFGGLTMINDPFSRLNYNLQSTFRFDVDPIFDESNFNDRVNLSVKCPFYFANFSEVKDVLAKQGVLLVKKYKPMNVVVIQDKNN